MKISNNGDSPDYGSYNMGTFPVSVALKIVDLDNLVKNLTKAVGNDDDHSSVVLFLNRRDIHLTDAEGVLRVTITLD